MFCTLLLQCLTTQMYKWLPAHSSGKSARKKVRKKVSLFIFCGTNGEYIIVIALCGVQLGLKSYMWFQNRMSTQHQFYLRSQVWFQSKIAQPSKVQLPLCYINFEIAQFKSKYKNCKILVTAIIYWTSSWKCIYTSFWKHVKIMSMWLAVLFDKK